MTTSRRLAANRANAQKSTGPKTLSGKQRSARNARKLGLSIPVAADSTFAVELASLAEQLARNSTSREACELATKAAEAQADLSRIRRARCAIFASVIEQPVAHPAQDHTVARSGTADRVSVLSQAIDRVAVIARYERRALSRRKRAIRQLEEILQRENKVKNT